MYKYILEKFLFHEEPMKIFFLLCENGLTNAEFLQTRILP